jgi:hypothetical protein
VNQAMSSLSSVVVFVGKLSKIMTNISQYSLSRGRDAEVSIDDTEQDESRSNATELNNSVFRRLPRQRHRIITSEVR